MKRSIKPALSVSWLISVLFLSSALLLSGCGAWQSNSGQGAGNGNARESDMGGQDSGKVSVVTTIFPPYDFVREVAGDNVEMKMLLKPGEESHSYEPTPQDIIAIQESDVFIYTGGENDVWVDDILSSMPDGNRLTLRLVDCVDTVEEEYVEGMKESRGHTHEEHAYEECAHEEHIHENPEDDVADEAAHSVHGIDEHVWTSPLNAALIVEQIKEALIEADPSNRAT